MKKEKEKLKQHKKELERFKDLKYSKNKDKLIKSNRFQRLDKFISRIKNIVDNTSRVIYFQNKFMKRKNNLVIDINEDENNDNVYINNNKININNKIRAKSVNTFSNKRKMDKKKKTKEIKTTTSPTTQFITYNNILKFNLKGEDIVEQKSFNYKYDPKYKYH